MTTPEGSAPTVFDHLVELRSRLLRAVAGLLLVLVALLPFANRLYGWVAQPLLDKLPAGAQLIAVEVASPFFAPLKLAFFVAGLACLLVAVQALLEAAHRLAQVLADVLQALGAEHQHHDHQHDQPVPETESTHGNVPLRGGDRIPQRPRRSG